MKAPFEKGGAGEFDEAKYQSLLEWLEIHEIKLSECLGETRYFGRLDSEFFQKKYRLLLSELIENEYDFLTNISFITDGEHGNPKTFPIGYAKYFGARNVLTGILNENNVDFITKEHHEKLRKSKLKTNDILISCVGANIGYAAIVPEDIGEANIVRNVALLRTKDANILNSYLLAYFLSKYGKQLFIRMASGNAQPLVSLDYIKSIPVFIPKSAFQNRINDLINEAKTLLIRSQQTYQQAETLLLETLGLKDFEPSQEKVNVKSFKESHIQSGRLDAEYYQVKYEEIVNIIQKLKHELLGSLVSIKKSIEPGSSHYDDKGIPFLRVADFNKHGITEPKKHLSSGFIKENIELLEGLKPKAKTILFSKDGSVGNALMLEKDENLITSGAILHLKVFDKKVVLPQYLTLVLNSLVVKMQAERDSGGSVILHWKPSEIEQVLIPIVDIEIQKQISKKVTESFRLKKQSEQLLKIAKTAVEMAIEKSEGEALGWMEDETKKLNLKK